MLQKHYFYYFEIAIFSLGILFLLRELYVLFFMKHKIKPLRLHEQRKLKIRMYSILGLIILEMLYDRLKEVGVF
jgi:hypothetical protein